MKIDGQLVLITGASQGIGEATAKMFAKQNCRVILLARSQENLEAIVKDICIQGGQAVAYPTDLSDPSAIEKVVHQITADCGVPDIIIHNAGSGSWKSIEDTSPEEALSMMTLPFFAAFSLTHYFLPAFKNRGSGYFLFVNSPACLTAWSNAAGYIASRQALLSLADSLYLEVKNFRIGVSTFIAGHVNSNYFKNNPESLEKMPKFSGLFPVLSVDEAAKEILWCIEKEKRINVRPRFYKFLYFYRLFPWLFEKLLST